MFWKVEYRNPTSRFPAVSIIADVDNDDDARDIFNSYHPDCEIISAKVMSGDVLMGRHKMQPGEHFNLILPNGTILVVAQTAEHFRIEKESTVLLSEPMTAR